MPTGFTDLQWIWTELSFVLGITMENQRTECFSEKAVKGKYVIISVETFAQTRPLVWSSEKSISSSQTIPL